MRAFAWSGAGLFAASLGYFGWQYFVAFGEPAPAGASAVVACAINVGLFTAFAMHHSILARAGVKARVSRAVSPRLERSVYVWAASLLFLGVCWAWRPVPGDIWRVTGEVAWLLRAGALAGAVVTLRAAAMLDVLELAGVRQAGGAAPARPSAILSHGVYGLVRHPIYLGWVLLVWGVPDMTATRFTFAAISTVYLVIAIPFEERSLHVALGPAYADYTRRVRWKIVPGVF